MLACHYSLCDDLLAQRRNSPFNLLSFNAHPMCPYQTTSAKNVGRHYPFKRNHPVGAIRLLFACVIYFSPFKSHG